MKLSPRLQRTRSALGRQPSGALRVAVGVVGIVIGAASCRSTARSTPAQSPVLTGRATYEALSEPNAEVSEKVAHREYIPAQPAVENRPPEYPRQLVGLNLPPQELVVRITLDEYGRPSQIQARDAMSRVDGRYRDAFDAAVRSAIGKWRFTPAAHRTFVDSPDAGSGAAPYKVLKSEVPIATYFDIRFTFEVRDGKGMVTGAR